LRSIDIRLPDPNPEADKERNRYNRMWKPSQPEPQSPPQAPPEPVRPAAPAAAPIESANRAGSATAADQASISKGLFIKGEITGSESLFIDGKVEGSINLNGNRVTVGRNGQVAASITAREVVVLGKVRGNVTATDRVDIRAEGALTGDVAAARISIEDGAFFKGGIDIRKPDQKPAAAPASAPTPAAAGQVK
jgi:cytoskeletal protein CcmA (bactofilin family)